MERPLTPDERIALAPFGTIPERTVPDAVFDALEALGYGRWAEDTEGGGTYWQVTPAGERALAAGTLAERDRTG